jgi:hypothetical protein
MAASNGGKAVDRWWGTALVASPKPKILTYLLRTSGRRKDRFESFCRILKSISYLFSITVDSSTPAASTNKIDFKLLI